MAFGAPQPFHTGPHAVLGEALFEAEPGDSYMVDDDVTEAGGMPVPPQAAPPPVPVLPPVVTLPQLVTRLDLILTEVRELRAELARRTVAARLRRAWNWAVSHFW